MINNRFGRKKYFKAEDRKTLKKSRRFYANKMLTLPNLLSELDIFLIS